jgi:hypothetical protein
VFTFGIGQCLVSYPRHIAIIAATYMVTTINPHMISTGFSQIICNQVSFAMRSKSEIYFLFRRSLSKPAHNEIMMIIYRIAIRSTKTCEQLSWANATKQVELCIV